MDAGEDPLFLARRVVRMAVEDIGLADPQALVICNAAKDAYDFLGHPEGELAIAQAVIYLATAPKSNAAYKAFGAAMRAAKEGGSLLPPKHILNSPTKLMKSEGYGGGYEYDHDAPEAFSGQDYFPEALGRQTFYDPPDRGFEREIRKRLDYWAKLRRNASEIAIGLMTPSTSSRLLRYANGSSGAGRIMSRRVKRPLAKSRRPAAIARRARSGRVGRSPRPSGHGDRPRRRRGIAGAAARVRRRARGAVRRRARQGRRRAAAAADQSADRRRDGGREQHARRPLSRGALSRPVVLPHPAHRPQRRAARQRQARRQQGPAGRGTERPHSAAQARCAQGRRRALGSRDEDARGAQGHDPVRGRRRHGAEQAGGACGAGRLRHHAACRPDAGSDARRQGPEAAAGAPARQGDRGLPAGRQDALCRDRADRIVPPSLGAQDLLGAGGGRAEAEAGPHLDLSRQGRERGRHHHARSPRMATRAPATP